jgi:carbohydrate kinase (thermoresistant glucokinase family)
VGGAIVYIVMGVSGSGKTTVGRLLATKLGLGFYDADDYHAPEEIENMKRGVPLNDDDRLPWLHALAAGISQWNKGPGAVLACSALKEEYRRILGGNGQEDVTFILLQGSPELIRSRLQNRRNHYFPPVLLNSQFQTLEVPRRAIFVEIAAAPEAVCDDIVQQLSARGILSPAAGGGEQFD